MEEAMRKRTEQEQRELSVAASSAGRHATFSSSGDR